MNAYDHSWNKPARSSTINSARMARNRALNACRPHCRLKADAVDSLALDSISPAGPPTA